MTPERSAINGRWLLLAGHNAPREESAHNTGSRRTLNMATPDRSYRRYRSWNADIDETGSDALLDYPSTESIPSKRPRCVSLWTCVLAVVTVVILFLLGFCLGYYIRESLSATQIQTFDCASYRKDKFNDSKLESVHEKIMYFIAEDPGRIRQFVR